MTAKRTSNQAGLGNQEKRAPKRTAKVANLVQDEDDNPDPPQPDVVALGSPGADIASYGGVTWWDDFVDRNPEVAALFRVTRPSGIPEGSPGELGSITSPLSDAAEVEEISHVSTGDDAPVEGQDREDVADDPTITETLRDDEETTANTKKKRGRPKLKGTKAARKVGRPRHSSNNYTEQVRAKYRQKHEEAKRNGKANRTSHACDRCKVSGH